MSIITLGQFDLIPESLPSECAMHLRFQPIDLIIEWRRCSLIANFCAAFYCQSKNRYQVDSNENILSTVLNELVENAAKFSHKRETQVTIDLGLYNKMLKIAVKNRVNRESSDRFKSYINHLFSMEDLDTLYIQKLESKTEESTESGLGLLMILKDYPVKIGVKINEENSEFPEIETQAYCQMEEI